MSGTSSIPSLVAKVKDLTMKTQFTATSREVRGDATMRLSVTNVNVPQDTSAGRFRVWDGLEIAAKTRPNWFHRMTMRLVFGWRWIDND